MCTLYAFTNVVFLAVVRNEKKSKGEAISLMTGWVFKSIGRNL